MVASEQFEVTPGGSDLLFCLAQVLGDAIVTIKGTAAPSGPCTQVVTVCQTCPPPAISSYIQEERPDSRSHGVLESVLAKVIQGRHLISNYSLEELALNSRQQLQQLQQRLQQHELLHHMDPSQQVAMERDGGFCSAGEEDDDGIHSPTDASEDSVDVKVQAISLRNKNKRKCAEPRRVDTDLPAKKRKLDLRPDDTKVLRESPFRPWNRSPPLPIKTESEPSRLPSLPSITPPSLTLPPDARFASDSHQEEPLSLVANTRQDGFKVCRKAITDDADVRLESCSNPSATWHTPVVEKETIENRLSPVPATVPIPTTSVISNRTKSHRVKNTSEKKRSKVKAEEATREDKFRIDSLLSSPGTSDFGSVSSAADRSKGCSSNGQQRNYKNMTRERRIEANARERTRVHTISAAFDTLRHSVPAYSHNQKLSKLSVLRIACSYIMTLSRIAGYDYSSDQSEPQVADCVDNVSRTIQTEGKIRKKKDE